MCMCLQVILIDHAVDQGLCLLEEQASEATSSVASQGPKAKLEVGRPPGHCPWCELQNRF